MTTNMPEVRNVSGTPSPNTELAPRNAGGARDDNPPNSRKSNRSARLVSKDRNQQTPVDVLSKYVGVHGLVPEPTGEELGGDTGSDVMAALARGSGGNVRSINGGPPVQSRSIGDWMHVVDRSGVHSQFTIFQDRRGPRTDYPAGPPATLNEPGLTDYIAYSRVMKGPHSQERQAAVQDSAARQAERDHAGPPQNEFDAVNYGG